MSEECVNNESSLNEDWSKSCDLYKLAIRSAIGFANVLLLFRFIRTIELEDI